MVVDENFIHRMTLRFVGAINKAREENGLEKLHGGEMSFGFEDGETVNYGEAYKRARESRLMHLVLPSDLEELMNKKMEEGKVKYAQLSFQNSFQNSIQVDIGKHIRDEIADILNYFIHWHICFSFYGDIIKVDEIFKTIGQVKELYKKIDEVDFFLGEE